MGERIRGLLRDGHEIRKPSPEIVEVHKILAGMGFEVDSVVFVDTGKKEATFGVLEIVAKPRYTDGTQMYYGSPDGDPLAGILARGRILQSPRESRFALPWSEIGKLVIPKPVKTITQPGIDVPGEMKHVPKGSRFAVSWEEIHGFVIPELVDAIPGLKKLIRPGGIVLGVPTKAEFQLAWAKDLCPNGPNSNGPNSWEWLHDETNRKSRLVGGRVNESGNVSVFDLLPDSHSDKVGFRFIALSLPQKFL